MPRDGMKCSPGGHSRAAAPRELASVVSESPPDRGPNRRAPEDEGDKRRRNVVRAAREEQIRNCGLRGNLKHTLQTMYRLGDWVFGTVCVSNEDLRVALTLKHVRNVQQRVKRLVDAHILLPQDIRHVRRTRWSNGRNRARTVKTWRIGGRSRAGYGYANRYKINFDALPPPLPPRAADAAAAAKDDPITLPLFDAEPTPASIPTKGDPAITLPATKGDPAIRVNTDPAITQSCTYRQYTDRLKRTATAGALATQVSLFPDFDLAVIEPRSVQLTSAQKRDLARAPNGNNAKNVRVVVYDLLDHPEEAARLLRSDTPIVWMHDSAAGPKTRESQGLLIEATKWRCAELHIDYGRDEAVRDDVVQRQVEAAWMFKFVISREGPRPRDEARRERRRSRRGPRL